MSEKTEDELFSFDRKTRQNNADMLRELEVFREYWALQNKGDFKKPVKLADYIRWDHARFSADTIRRFFGNWQNACVKANLNPWKNPEYGDLEIIDLVENVWRWRGQRPTIDDLKKYNLEHGTMLDVGTVARRWGTWKKFLMLISKMGRGQISKEDVIKAKQDASPRDPISPGMRTSVLNRDNYTCVDCGASPRKDQSVTLHIHHLKPVSKGGKSTLDNLVTNCRACNLGKGDRIDSA